MPLPYPRYLDLLRTESARFREVLGGCDPTARVPACPDWDAADLLWHLAGVQWFWAATVRVRPGTVAEAGLARPRRPDGYAGLLAAFDDLSAALAIELERADPAEPAWHWSPDRTVATSYRRQTHEALIHRIDAEQTAGVEEAPIDPALAADGVVEVLDVMFGGHPAWGRFTPSGQTVRVDLRDAEPVTVALGRFAGTDPDGVAVDEVDLGVIADDGAPTAATISGTAADVDRWLWHRDDGAGVQRDGDAATLETLLGILRQPLN